MITRRRRTRSSGEDNDQTRVEFSSENNFSSITVDMTTCRDRTSEFISAVKSLQSRQVKSLYLPVFGKVSGKYSTDKPDVGSPFKILKLVRKIIL